MSAHFLEIIIYIVLHFGIKRNGLQIAVINVVNERGMKNGLVVPGSNCLVKLDVPNIFSRKYKYHGIKVINFS